MKRLALWWLWNNSITTLSVNTTLTINSVNIRKFCRTELKDFIHTPLLVDIGQLHILFTSNYLVPNVTAQVIIIIIKMYLFKWHCHAERCKHFTQLIRYRDMPSYQNPVYQLWQLWHNCCRRCLNDSWSLSGSVDTVRDMNARTVERVGRHVSLVSSRLVCVYTPLRSVARDELCPWRQFTRRVTFSPPQPPWPAPRHCPSIRRTNRRQFGPRQRRRKTAMFCFTGFITGPPT